MQEMPGKIPDPERIPYAPEQLSLSTATTKPVLQSPGAATTEVQAPRAHAPQREACTLPLESTPHSPQLEKSMHSNEDPAWPKVNK